MYFLCSQKDTTVLLHRSALCLFFLLCALAAILYRFQTPNLASALLYFSDRIGLHFPQLPLFVQLAESCLCFEDYFSSIPNLEKEFQHL